MLLKSLFTYGNYEKSLRRRRWLALALLCVAFVIALQVLERRL